MSENRNEQALLDAGVAIAKPVELSPDYYGVVVPEGYEFKTDDHSNRNEKLQEVPRRNTGVVTVANVDSFLRFTERELLPETTVSFADLNGKTFRVIFNYSAGGDKPGWADRQVLLELKKTAEWMRWDSMNRRRMSQMDLADFIEENLDTISSPPAADLIEMIGALRVKRHAQFDSVIDQNTGMQSIAFSEETKGETINGNIEFHGKFQIGVAPFHGSEKYGIDCNLRFSIDSERSLRIFFSMINIEAVLEDAFNVERQKIVDAFGTLGVPVFDQ